MAVVNIPPDGNIYSIGPIDSLMHIYNTDHPHGVVTNYYLTILNVGYYPNVAILPGHTDTYQPAGNKVFIQNNGPSRLQMAFLAENEKEITPDEAGWTVVKDFPKYNEAWNTIGYAEFKRDSWYEKV